MKKEKGRNESVNLVKEIKMEIFGSFYQYFIRSGVVLDKMDVEVVVSRQE